MEEPKVTVTEVKDGKDIPEVRTYRLEFVGAVLDGEEAKAIRKVVNTPPIAIDRTLIVEVDAEFTSMSKEDQAAKAKEITEAICKPGGQYQNVLILPKGYQFMRAVEI